MRRWIEVLQVGTDENGRLGGWGYIPCYPV